MKLSLSNNSHYGFNAHTLRCKSVATPLRIIQTRTKTKQSFSRLDKGVDRGANTFSPKCTCFKRFQKCLDQIFTYMDFLH